MTPVAAYGLGVISPFVALILWAAWDAGLEGLGRWWDRRKPTLAALGCLLAGHAYVYDNGWRFCRRCGHSRHLEVPS